VNNGTAPPAEIRNEGAEWNRLRERIQSSMEAVERKFNPTELERNAILSQRAKRLARPSTDLLGDLEGASVLEFLIAGEKYGVESSYVSECFQLRDLTPLPCTPRFVRGIINVRGRIVCAIDLDLLLDLPAAESNDRSAVVVLNGAGIETGVLIDAILGVRSIPEGEIRQSLSTLNGIQAEYLKGVTRDNVAVLDVLTILSDPRIRVHEEVD